MSGASAQAHRARHSPRLSHTAAARIIHQPSKRIVMARVKLNPIIDQLRGKVGDLVFREVSGNTVLSRTPDLSGVEPTPGQEAQRARFRDAAFYGRVVLADPPARAFYEGVAEGRGKPLFSVIVGDYLNTPEVGAVDTAGYTGAVGDPVLVQASDDVE